ncbi:MAG: translation elongation factor Ts [Anaerolineae bacterium]
MAITTDMIKRLREETGAGVLECKKALEASNADFEKAITFLRERGLATAAKKASREANDGLVSLQVDAQGRWGVILEVNCETDFVARTEDFRTFTKALLRQLCDEPAISDVATLLERPFVLDHNVTVGQQLTALVAKLGENIIVRRFARLQRDGSGWIEGYLHPGDRIGVILYVSASDTGVAESAAFRELVHDLALQVAAAAPKYVAPVDIPSEVLEAERAMYRAQIADEKKPEPIKERIIAGKLDKWYEAVCLLRQPFIKDDALRVADLLEQKSKQLGTPLTVERFVRYELGMGE